MNPEEGKLRPQILDRFGLRVVVRGLVVRPSEVGERQCGARLQNVAWPAALADKYDGRGQLYRVGMNYITQQYDVPCPFPDAFSITDLVTNSYAINAIPTRGQKGILYHNKPFPPKDWTADSLAAGGIR